MRTLKKTLALVLVLAMMFSLCITASADFVDADEIQYTEAVEVLSAIGVIEGIGNDVFDPTGTLTRAQAATILVRLLGAEDLATAAEASFTDVAADHWAAAAIAYCAEQGIVDGYGDGKFYPSDPLTGYQWAKMLLVGVLGYDAEEEGMTGTAWQLPTAKLANSVGLFADNDKANKAVAATREEACLYALNAATYKTGAEYGYPVISTTGDVSSNIGYYDTVIEAAAAATILNESAGDDTTITYGAKKVLAKDGSYLLKDVHKVTYVAADNDDFGRPGSSYSRAKLYGTINLFFYDELVGTYTTAMQEADLYAAIGADGIQGKFDKYIVMDEIYVNGVCVESADPDAAAGADKAAGSSLYANSVVVAKNDKVNANIAGMGNGVVTEIYATATPNRYIMVCMPEYLGTVSTVTKADEKAGTDRYITVAGMEYETEEFAKGDKVLYTIANGATGAYIANVAAPEVLEGAVSKITNGAVYTIGDATYVLSQNKDVKNINVSTTPGKWYLDSCGNIIGDVEVRNFVPTYYGVLVEAAQQPYDGGSILNDAKETIEKVKFYNAAGELVTLDTAWTQTYDNAGNITGETFKAAALFNAANGNAAATSKSYILFSYKLDANGKMYDIAACADGGNVVLENGDAKVYKTAGGETYSEVLTDKTVVFVKTASGVKAYTGYTAIPDVNGDCAGYASTGSTFAALYIDTATIDDSTDAKYVYVKTLASTVETVVLPSGTPTTVTTYTDVYVDGALVEGGMVFAPNTTLAEGGLYSFTTNAQGVSTIGSNLMNENASTVAAVNSGYYTVTSAETTPIYVDKDTAYYEYDATAKTLTAAESLPALSATGAYTVKVMAADGIAGLDKTQDIVVYVIVYAD